MTGEYLLDFHHDDQGTLLLPAKCSVSVDCYDSDEVQRAVVSSIQECLYALALAGMDLRALDGISVALDTRLAACALQELPEGAVPLEMTDQPETFELARTVAVKRGEEFRFHIVLRSGLGLMALSSNPDQQALACGCIAHEAAHVEHEAHLYKCSPTFTGAIWTAATVPGRASSRRSTSGVNMQPAGQQRCFVLKH